VGSNKTVTPLSKTSTTVKSSSVGCFIICQLPLVVPILPITRQRLDRLKQFSSRIPHRDGGLEFLQIGFEKMVGDDQRLDRLTSIAAASLDCLIGSRL
jgi:hypothetical protein